MKTEQELLKKLFASVAKELLKRLQRKKPGLLWVYKK
jgi:hypothetical protein